MRLSVASSQSRNNCRKEWELRPLLSSFHRPNESSLIEDDVNCGNTNLNEDMIVAVVIVI